MTKSTAPSPKRELTLRVIVLGLLLAVVMGAANVYVGLKAGMTVSASIPAAVMAMVLFKMLFKDSSILEANQVQTCASAGESLAAGIIFTMPALIMIGFWTEFEFWTVAAVAFTGGLLGILFMIPMRRVFVVDNDELPYPEGIACAAVLEAGQEDDESSGVSGGGAALVAGGVIGALFKIAGGLLGLFAGSLEAAKVAGSRIFYYGCDASPMLVAVGLIVRLNVALLIFIGGAIAWLIGIPMLGQGEEYAGDAVGGAWDLWSGQMRYVGVGAMVVGGMASIVTVRSGLVAAVRELTGGRDKSVELQDHERDLPMGVIVPLAGLCIILVGFIYYHFTDHKGITLLAVAVMAVMAFFFTAVASYIVGLVGNSNSPVSGMTITAVLFTGGMLAIAGFSGMEGMVATIGVAAVICCVACTAGDVCNDLKTGSIVGASPFRQQIMQIIGVAIASLVMAPVLTLLHENTEGGIGGRELPAPQAGLFAALAKGFAGEGDLPWNLISYGAIVGVVILVIDGVLKSKKTKFRMHLMPIAVGMYLPFGLATPILIGGIMAHFITRDSKTPADEERVMQKGVLFASGVIAGEALLGVGLAGLAAMGVGSLKLLEAGTNQELLTLVAFVATLGLFWKFARPSKR